MRPKHVVMKFDKLLTVTVPQISSVSAYILRNLKCIRYACKILLYANILYYAGNYFSERNETQLIFTSTFRLCRVSLVFFSSPLRHLIRCLLYQNVSNQWGRTSLAAGLDILDIVQLKNEKYQKNKND